MTVSLGSEKRTAVHHVLEARGIIRRGGHFEYSSGEHGSNAVNTELLYKDLGLLRFLARKLARHFQSLGIETVVGLIGDEYQSLLLAMMIAEELSNATLVTGRKKNSLEKVSIASGDEKYIRGKRVLVIDDVVDTGKTVMNTVSFLKAAKANVVGVGVICDRGSLWFWLACTLTDYKYRSLVTLDSKRWTKQRCQKDGPCRNHVPLVKVKTQPAYVGGK